MKLLILEKPGGFFRVFTEDGTELEGLINVEFQSDWTFVDTHRRVTTQMLVGRTVTLTLDNPEIIRIISAPKNKKSRRKTGVKNAA